MVKKLKQLDILEEQIYPIKMEDIQTITLSGTEEWINKMFKKLSR